MNSRTRRLLVAVLTTSALASVALAPNLASAGLNTTGTILDDPGNNPPPYDTALGGKHPNDAGTRGCDTISPLTQNRDLVAYNNNAENATDIRACVGEADILSYSLDTLTPGKITWKVETRYPIPPPGSTAAAQSGAHTFSYYVFFQNARKQNKRQIVGETLDCTGFSHQGPFLSGNNEYFFFTWKIALAGPTWVESKGWGHYDPVGQILYETRFYNDLPGTALSQFCTGAAGGLAHSTVTFPGTGVTDTVSRDAEGNGVLTVTVPQNYCWVNPSGIVNCYRIASPGDTITGVKVATYGEVDVVRTPDLSQITPALGPTGVGLNSIFDWATFAGFDLGIFTPGTERLPGSGCPNFEASQYFTNGEQGATYVNGGNAMGADRDTQVNPFYGLNHYDRSEEIGPVNSLIGPQDHHGPDACNVFIPTAAHFKSTVGGSITVTQ